MDTLLDLDKMSDKELGAAIRACHITSADECLANSIRKCPADDQACTNSTIPELVHEGLKDEQYKALSVP